MSSRIKEFSRWVSGWIASNIAWDILKWLISFLFGGIIVVRLPEGIMSSLNRVLAFGGLSAFNYAIAFILIAGTIFGAFSLATPPIRWIKTYILRSDSPHLLQDNEWNAIINLDGKNVCVAMISIANNPAKNTDNSVVFNLSASLDFYDRKDNHLLHIKCGYWTRTSPEKFLAEFGKKKRCEKIDFYANEKWYLPIVYKWEDDDLVFACDPTSPIKSKKLGKLPIKLSIAFEGENLKPMRQLNYQLIPQPMGMPDGFWIQKK